MLKKICLLFLFICFLFNAIAHQVPVKADSLINILKLQDESLRNRRLVRYLHNYFEEAPVDSLKFFSDKNEIVQLLSNYNINNPAAYALFIESMYQPRLLHPDKAKRVIIEAINLADKSDDHFLLYSFYSQLGFLQTSEGNTIEAISHFRRAKRESNILNDAYLQMVIDINISDIYYRNNFYLQSLSYLNQAADIWANHHLAEPRLRNLIYYNKAENYFRMNNVDSLKIYNTILNNVKSGTSRLYIYKKRTDYYLALLNHDYKSAIKNIEALRNDTLYMFDSTDEQNLADAYFNAGNLPKAAHIINYLLAMPELNNHPEIKIHLYKVLGQISEKQNNDKQAAVNYKMSLQQSDDYINRITRVGDISSQIRTDEVQGAYNKKEASYKRERVWLIFAVIVTVLCIIIGAMIYSNTRQKGYYEKLLFDTKKEELAFINSHEVRRHLSNILGIIHMIKQSEDPHGEYIQAEDHLLNAAESLDIAIKDISKKLDA